MKISAAVLVTGLTFSGQAQATAYEGTYTEEADIFVLACTDYSIDQFVQRIKYKGGTVLLTKQTISVKNCTRKKVPRMRFFLSNCVEGSFCKLRIMRDGESTLYVSKP